MCRTCPFSLTALQPPWLPFNYSNILSYFPFQGLFLGYSFSSKAFPPIFTQQTIPCPLGIVLVR